MGLFLNASEAVASPYPFKSSGDCHSFQWYSVSKHFGKCLSKSIWVYSVADTLSGNLVHLASSLLQYCSCI